MAPAGAGAVRAPDGAVHNPAADPSSGAAGTRSITRLAWLAGCWETERNGRIVEEQWMAPRGGMMLGLGRTVRGDSTLDYEQVMILEEGGQLVYRARPAGQDTAHFRSIELTDSLVVFQNLAHDYPQRVLYRRLPDGSLSARVEGERGGKLRGLDFPYRRVSCP